MARRVFSSQSALARVGACLPARPPAGSPSQPYAALMNVPARSLPHFSSLTGRQARLIGWSPCSTLRRLSNLFIYYFILLRWAQVNSEGILSNLGPWSSAPTQSQLQMELSAPSLPRIRTHMPTAATAASDA